MRRSRTRISRAVDGSYPTGAQTESVRRVPRADPARRALPVNRRAEGEADLLLGCGEVWEDPPEDVASLAFLTSDEAQALALDADRGR